MLSVLRVRDILVRTRTKPTGPRIPSCNAERFANHASRAVPQDLRLALNPLIEQIRSITNLIRRYDRKIERIKKTRYPATQILQRVSGVRALTALGFVLTIGGASGWFAAGMQEPTSDSVRGVSSQGKAIHNWESAKKATVSCEDCWSMLPLHPGSIWVGHRSAALG